MICFHTPNVSRDQTLYHSYPVFPMYFGLEHVRYIKNGALLPCVQVGLRNAQIVILYRHQIARKWNHFSA